MNNRYHTASWFTQPPGLQTSRFSRSLSKIGQIIIKSSSNNCKNNCAMLFVTIYCTLMMVAMLVSPATGSSQLSPFYGLSQSSHYYHNQPHNSQVPFKTSFVAPSDYMSFRKMNGPLESLSPGADEPSRLSVEVLLGSSSINSGIGGAISEMDTGSSELDNNKSSSANQDDLQAAASSSKTSAGDDQQQIPNINATTTTTTAANNKSIELINSTIDPISTSNTPASVEPAKSSQYSLDPSSVSNSNETGSSSTTTMAPQTTTSVAAVDDTKQDYNNNSSISQAPVESTTESPTTARTTVEITVNLSTLSSVVPTETTTLSPVAQSSSPTSPSFNPNQSTPYNHQDGSSQASNDTTLTSNESTRTPVDSTIANKYNEASTTPSPSPEMSSGKQPERSINQTQTQTQNPSSTKQTTDSPQAFAPNYQSNLDNNIAQQDLRRQQQQQQQQRIAAELAFEQNLSRQVNEFIFLPHDGPLTFEEELRDPKLKPQGPNTPTSELKAEHRLADDSRINLGDEVELDYINPETDRLAAPTTPKLDNNNNNDSPTISSSTKQPQEYQQIFVNHNQQQQQQDGSTIFDYSRTNLATDSKNTSPLIQRSSPIPSSSTSGSTPTSSTTTTVVTPTRPSTTSSTTTTTTTTSSTTTTAAKPTTTTRSPEASISIEPASSIGNRLVSSSNKLISQVVSMFRNQQQQQQVTTRRPRFDWKRGKSMKESHDNYFRRDLSPIANGADEEEARILTRLSAPSQLTRLSSRTTTQSSQPSSAIPTINHGEPNFNRPRNVMRQQNTITTNHHLNQNRQQVKSIANNHDGDRRQVLNIRGSSEIRSNHIEIGNRRDEDLPTTSELSRQNLSSRQQQQKSAKSLTSQDLKFSSTPSNPITTTTSTTTTTTTTNKPGIVLSSTREILVKTQRASPVPIQTVGLPENPTSSTSRMTTSNATTTKNPLQTTTGSSSSIAINATTTSPPLKTSATESLSFNESNRKSVSTTTSSSTPKPSLVTSGAPSTDQEETVNPIEEVLTLIAGTAANQSRSTTSTTSAISSTTTKTEQNKSRDEQNRAQAIEAAVIDMIHQREVGSAHSSKASKSSMQTNSYGSKPRIVKTNGVEPGQKMSKSNDHKVSGGGGEQQKPAAVIKLRGSLEEMKQQDEEQFRNTVRAESRPEASLVRKPHQRSSNRVSATTTVTESPTDSGQWKPDITSEPRRDSSVTTPDQLPGRPGIDYPTYWQVPRTSFDCRNFDQSGFYADVESSCQAYHSCHKGRGGQHTFLCPNGTLFSQELLTCDWWYNVECSGSIAKSSGKNVNNLDKSFMLRPANELSSAS